MADINSFDDDPTLYLFTSLTAGSSHIITATSRLETILKANKIPFQALDTATEERARKLWGRRGGKRKLPGLVKQGVVLGDLEQIEEWNEFGELKQNIGPVPSLSSAPSGPSSSDLASQPPTATSATSNIPHNDPIKPAQSSSLQSASTGLQPGAALKQLGAEVAAKAKERITPKPTPGVNETKIRPLPSDVAAAPEQANPTGPSAAEQGKHKESNAPTEGVASLVLEDQATKPETISSSADAKTASIKGAEENAKEADKALSPAAASVGSLAAASGDAKPPEAVQPPPPPEEGKLEPVSSSEPSSENLKPRKGSDLAAASQENLEAVGLPAAGKSDESLTHRGSSVSVADEEAVKEIERSTAIPEEEEAEATGAGVGGARKAEDVAEKEEAKVEDTVKTQEQEPAEAEKAGESVKD
ncbi:MAG: hypothetical protein M1820_008511 [Bogoriella megaspora]|nr:MAG: hypothetical protein M1820_008511 [Bogoriella megaspora]